MDRHVQLNPAWIVALVLVLAAYGAIMAGSRERHAPRDPVRLFTSAQRHECFRLAGNRCEFKPVLGARCTARPTHGDHVYPWAKGGMTRMSNQQALCARHNLSKGARTPSPLYVWRLSRRRRHYYPAGADPKVEWRSGLAH